MPICPIDRVASRLTREKPKYRVNDKVYINQGRGLEGPFVVSSVDESKKYVLEREDGTKVENGRVYDDTELISSNSPRGDHL